MDRRLPTLEICYVPTRQYKFIGRRGIVPMVSGSGKVRGKVAEVATGQVSSKHVLAATAILEYVVLQSRILRMQKVALMRFPINDRSPSGISSKEEFRTLPRTASIPVEDTRAHRQMIGVDDGYSKITGTEETVADGYRSGICLEL